MTDNIQQKIYEVFQKETGLSFRAIDKLLSDNNIQIIDEASIKNAIPKHKAEIDKIVIPQVIGSETRIIDVRLKNYTVLPEYVNIERRFKIYENGMTEKEVNKLKKKKSFHQDNFYLLELLLRITQRFTPQEMTTSSGSKSKSKKSNQKRDTTPKKNIFIDSFIELSFTKVYGKNSQKIIAKDTGISEGSVSRFLNELEVLKKIQTKMNILYSNNSDDPYFPVNYTLIGDRISDIEKKNALPEYHKTVEQKKQLNKDTEKGSKFVSFNELTENEMNDDTDRSFASDEEN